MRRLLAFSVSLLFAVSLSACDEPPTATSSPGAEASGPSASAQGGAAAASDVSYAFEGGPVFDIEAVPNGNILVPVSVPPATDPSSGTSTTTIREIRTNGPGGVRDYGQVETPAGVPINGLASQGRGSLYAARGGLDLAVAAAVLHVTPDGSRLVGDVEAFEKTNDPDAFAVDPGTPGVPEDDWKNPACEWAGDFTEGPQSNPFHLTTASGGTVLLADAAGNVLYRVERSGQIEVVAVFTPPTSDGSLDPGQWMMHPTVREGDDDPEGALVEPCYAQPVPESVAVGPDGAIYVGELTGLVEGAPFGTAQDKSRVWRIEPGAEGTVCPSGQCQLAVDERFTSIIDLATGPEGDLWIVEYDENGWLSIVVPPIPTAGGTVNRCDLDAGTCRVATVGGEQLSGLTAPAAITFDDAGNLWLLENNLAEPTVRRVGSP